MSDIDYEELFRSPLDAPEVGGRNAWGPIGLGFVAGVIGALLAAAVVGGGDEPATVVSTAPPPSSSTKPPAVVEYPAGYQAYVPGLGVKAEEVVVRDEVVSLAFTTVFARDADPLEPTWPVGGTWWLEAADGIGAESNRVVLGRFSPGAFSVEFPAAPFEGSSGFARALLIERWDHPTVTGEQSAPFSGEPYVMAEPLIIPIDQEVTLIIEELELGRFLGRVTWSLEGPGEPIARVLVSAVLLDADGAEVGTFGAFPALVDPDSSGETEILWQEPFPTSQDGAVTVVVQYSVGLVEVAATDLVIDLSAVPVGR